MIFEYRGTKYPDYLRRGNACQFIAPVALQFCKGKGLDVGSGKWPLPGAIPVDLANGGDAMNLPEGRHDFVFSSHCLEHLPNPVAALEHWKSRLRPGGVLFLYLPHPDMEYWLPQNNRKHLHSWRPSDIEKMLWDLGLVDVLRSERDLAWGFSVVGRLPCVATSRTFEFKSRVEAFMQHAATVGTGRAADAFHLSALHIRDGAGVIDSVLGAGRYRTVLEIGTYRGIATAYIAPFVDQVVTIDLKAGRLEQDDPAFDRFAFWRAMGANNIDLRLVSSNEEKAALIAGLDFDLAFIDGGKNDIAQDFASVSRCGAVLFHDYDHRDGAGNLNAVYDFVNSLPRDEVQVMDIFALWTATKNP